MLQIFHSRWGLLLRWWLLFTLINFALLLLFLTGVVDKVYDVDFTRLSFVIFIIFYGFFIRGGVLSYKMICKEPDIDEIFRENEIGWFISDMLLNLGMIGTVLGFICMLSTCLSGPNISDPANLQIVISNMSLGMGTALYTTAAGLTCSLILKLQLFDLNQYIEKKDEKIQTIL